MRCLAALLILAALSAPEPAEANPFCSWLGLCFYYSPGFELTVVDAETGKPLSGVYAWAEWVQYGAHGLGGPLVVQDAFSDTSGRLTFPRWGPTWGSRMGVSLGLDPAVILFKSGYATLLVQNGVPPGSDHRAAIRGLSHNGETVRLQPHRGSHGEWVKHIRQLVYPPIHGNVNHAHRDRFAALYVRRANLANRELRAVPTDTPGAAALQRALDSSMRFYRGEE